MPLSRPSRRWQAAHIAGAYARTQGCQCGSAGGHWARRR
jgi:hypothetical protein